MMNTSEHLPRDARRPSPCRPPLNAILVTGVALIVVFAGCGALQLPGIGHNNTTLTGKIGIVSSPYQVIDLVDGSLQSFETIPDLVTNPIYRTAKLVFRRVDAGAGPIGPSVGDPLDPAGAPASAQNTGTVSPYFLGVFELTQAQWQLLDRDVQTNAPWLAVNAGLVGSATPGDAMPAFALSYDVIENVLVSFNRGKGFQLAIPTRLQWEHACRAGAPQHFSWGVDFDASYSSASLATAKTYVVASETAAGLAKPLEVAKNRLANAFGFFDMQGNVWEWTKEVDLAGMAQIRGGSWHDSLIQARSANAIALRTDDAHPLVGVRLALSP